MANTFTSMIDLVYPVGSVFLGYGMSSFADTNGTIPGVKFGGSWVGLAAGRMLRSGWDSATGGNDVHSHMYGTLMRGYYGVASGNLNNPDELITLVNAPGLSSTTDVFYDNVWSAEPVGVITTNASLTPQTRSDDAGYAVNRTLAMSGKNIAYKSITRSASTTVNQKLSDAQLLNHAKSIEKSSAVCIPAYQTINTWYRTA